MQVENDKPYEVTIVGSGEIKIQDGEIAISLESPIGQAIRGKAVGEVAKMRLNNVKKDVTILAIQ
ncbi:GreA/GreB family elongation factor [bacterium]|nr:GreA/GreB family elongation factor [bacterium]